MKNLSIKNYKYKDSFSRYEFKYILTENLSKRLENEVKNFMKYDSFIHRELENRYFVRSLYFDNKFFSNFYEKVDGMKIRKKYRLRTYGETFDSKVPIFLEVKGRYQERSYKNRTIINHKDLDLFLDHSSYFILLKKYPNNKIVRDFVFDSLKKKLIPSVLVDYKRRPYINKFGLYFRLTFDSNITCGNTKSLFPNPSSSYKLKCKPGYTILELKFDRSISAWFHKIIQSYNLRRKSVSKFVLGVTGCNLAKETSE